MLPLQILLCLVLAYSCVSACWCMLPFPRLASDELLDRYQLALLTLSRRVRRGGAAATCRQSPWRPQVLHTQVSSQLESVWKSLSGYASTAE